MANFSVSGCILLVATTLITSCSTFHKMAISGSSGLLYNASGDVETQGNYEVVKSAMPANLVLLEGLLSASPDNLNITATLNKGYAGLAFAVSETQMLEDEWSEAKHENGKTQALFNYTRALDYGMKYLNEKDVRFDELVSRAGEPQIIHHLLDKKLSTDKRDLETVLFTAQALGALINLQKDSMIIVAQLPVAKALFDWVCSKDPQINYGTCDIFYGAYEAGRPQMLGGNPQKGKDIFLKAIARHPHNWLIRTSYLQYYLIPQNDEEGFKEQMDFLNGVHENFKSHYIYTGAPHPMPEWGREEKLRLYQALALKRFELMNQYKKTFF